MRRADSVDGFAVIAIALQPALGLLGAVLPGTTHRPVLIHQAEQVGADAPEQGSLFHPFKLARAWQGWYKLDFTSFICNDDFDLKDAASKNNLRLGDKTKTL